MVSDTLPNFNASPDVFIKDINNRAEDILIHHAKREFADYIELKLPQESSAKEKYKSAVAKVYFLLRKINIKAAMDGSHDLLGKFYEVFLKYGNGAKDIGIVLTPRHITEFGAEILNIVSTDLVYDPACGTGGFLVAAYDKVRREDIKGVEMFKKHRIFGIEQQANVAALAIVNMIFRGDGKNNIINGDCLTVDLNMKVRNKEASAEYINRVNTSDDDTSEKASLLPPVTKVMMNPPFSLKRDDEQEYTFINHALNQMREGGLLLCVIPVSVMYASGKEAEWRKRLIEYNTLLSVISLPNDLFYPQASVESVIIIVKKGIPQENNKCLFVRIKDDGFLKQKRRRIKNNKVSQLESLKEDIYNFIHSGHCKEIQGVIQAKELNLNHVGLELIPQQYLDNEKLSAVSLKSALGKLHSELLFQQIRKGLSNENR
ncbi:N-6 DNA methylase [Serratia marcescens]|nr:N-6 DNA methylase [Serratia marcescens]